MRVQIASYAPVPDRPAHNITTYSKSQLRTVGIHLDIDIPDDQDLAQLEFRLRIIPGVADISIEGRNIIVTYKADHSWPRVCLRICDRLVSVFHWSYHNTTIDGTPPNWFDRSGTTAL